jgi:hypothetical protein
VRLRRLRHGPLALTRLRPDPPARPGLAHDCAVDDCTLTGIGHRHLTLHPLPEPPAGPNMPTPRDTGRGKGRPADMPTRGTTDGAGQAHSGRTASPYRPHPPVNAWPDDALTVTYAELRALVAHHLELAAQMAPRDRPWAWLDARALAVRDGEAPLLISDVLDRTP